MAGWAGGGSAGEFVMGGGTKNGENKSKIFLLEIK